MGYMHTCTYICKYTYIITFTCVHTGVPPYILTYMLLLLTKVTCLNINAFIHMHVYICIYKQTCIHK